MSQSQAIDVAHGALMMVLTLAGPGVAAILAVGLIVSAFQAMTQINEQTLSFVPKLAVIVGVFVVFGPWMLQEIVAYTVATISQMPTAAH
jgi:flagellar biosynthetic protein FliQ